MIGSELAKKGITAITAGAKNISASSRGVLARANVRTSALTGGIFTLPEAIVAVGALGAIAAMEIPWGMSVKK